MDTLVISIDASGACASLHNDNFDLGFLGDKKVYRQSDIVFNEESQKWDIVYLDGAERKQHAILNGFKNYEEARQSEVAWLNACREYNYHPLSDDGISIMMNHRFPPLTTDKSESE
jgi:hypothetical protein